jgi:hypothetical protein
VRSIRDRLRRRFGQRLHTVAVDERALPDLEVEKTPDAVGAFGASRRVIVQ